MDGTCIKQFLTFPQSNQAVLYYRSLSEISLLISIIFAIISSGKRKAEGYILFCIQFEFIPATILNTEKIINISFFFAPLCRMARKESGVVFQNTLSK